VKKITAKKTKDFNNISMLDRATGYMDCLAKEAVEIGLSTENF
jgi:hypothetical protein